MSSGSSAFWSKSSTTTANLQHGECHHALQPVPDSGSKRFQPTPCGGRRCSRIPFSGEQYSALAAKARGPPYSPGILSCRGRRLRARRVHLEISGFLLPREAAAGGLLSSAYFRRHRKQGLCRRGRAYVTKRTQVAADVVCPRHGWLRSTSSADA